VSEFEKSEIEKSGEFDIEKSGEHEK